MKKRVTVGWVAAGKLPKEMEAKLDPKGQGPRDDYCERIGYRMSEKAREGRNLDAVEL